MKKLAIIEHNEDSISIVKEYFETDPEAFENWCNESERSLADWAALTQTVNYGVISYLHTIGALWIDENNEFQVDFKNFTVASVIDGLLSNEPYLPEEMTTHFGYVILKKGIKQIKKLFPKGRSLPIRLTILY